MRMHGFLDVARIGFAELLRWLTRGPLWLAEMLTIAADLVDPAMPETIRRWREWLPRLWSRWHRPDSQLPR